MILITLCGMGYKKTQSRSESQGRSTCHFHFPFPLKLLSSYCLISLICMKKALHYATNYFVLMYVCLALPAELFFIKTMLTKFSVSLNSFTLNICSF